MGRKQCECETWIKLGQMEMRPKGEHLDPKGLRGGRAGETWGSERLRALHQVQCE